MSAEYKILHFVANPIAGVRVPVALLLREPEKPLAVVKNPAPPSGECLGDPYAASAIQHALPRVEQLDSFERLPALLGPQFALSEARAFHGTNARERLTEAVFPTWQEEKAQKKSKARARRSKLGKLWFERRGLWGIVKKTYSPSEGIPSISHFAQSNDMLMLMEPLSSDRGEKALKNDSKDVVGRLLAHASYEGHRVARRRLVAYFLPGRYNGLIAKVREDLGCKGDVIECGNLTQAHTFEQQLRELGAQRELSV